MKQTAVEWLIESLEKLEYDLEKGNISLDDYIINAKWFKNRAKEKEKEQHIKTARQWTIRTSPEPAPPANRNE